MDSKARDAIMRRLEDCRAIYLRGYFNFIYTPKKKFPYLKIDDNLINLLHDLIRAQGFHLTWSFLNKNPGTLLPHLAPSWIIILRIWQVSACKMEPQSGFMI